MLEESGDRTQLVEQYEYLLSKAPDNLVLRYNLGVIHYELGHLEQSEALLSQIVRDNPDDLDARQYLFDIYRRLNAAPQGPGHAPMNSSGCGPTCRRLTTIFSTTWTRKETTSPGGQGIEMGGFTARPDQVP
jgi:tetratricopeptide (TPR) repeat protein